jgi:PAS domain S-box-containing protein
MMTPRQAALFIGLLVAALGICVLAGWALDLTALKGAARGLMTMKPSTAAQTLLCGATLALLSREPIGTPVRWVTAAMASAVIAVAVLSLGADVFGWHLGTDHWLFRQIPGAATASSPGQMSPITAFCSLAVGGTLLMATLPIPRSLRSSALAGLGTATIVIGGFALMGHMSDVLLHFPVWNYGDTTLQAAAGFMLLGCGFVALACNGGALTWSLDRLTTVGFVFGISVLLVSEGLSNNHSNQLQKAIARVEQIHVVVEDLQQISLRVMDLEANQPGYDAPGDESPRHTGASTTSIEEQLITVRRLTADDPYQQRRLDQLAPLIAQLDEFGRPPVEVREAEDSLARRHGSATGPDIALTNNIQRLAREMEQEEGRLLESQQHLYDAISARSHLLMPLSVDVSVVILALGLFALNARTGDRARSDAALREERARLADLIDSAMDAIITIDSAQNILLFNPTAERMFRVSAASVVGGALAQLIPQPFGTPNAGHGVEHAAADGSRMGSLAHVTGLRPYGEEFPIEASISQIEVNGHRHHTFILRDIGERRRLEANAQRTRSFTDAMIESMPGILFLYNEHGTSLRPNRQFSSLSGYSDDEIDRMHPLQFFRSEDGGRLTQFISEVFDKGESSIETDFVSKDARETPYLLTGRRLLLDGSTCLVGIGIDITVRRQVEATRARLAAIVEASDDAIIGRDINGIITSWNRGAARLFGYSSDEMLGLPMTHLLPPHLAYEEEHILGRIRQGDNVEHLETVRRKKDGQLIDVSVTVSPIRDTTGKIVGASKIARDVTETKRIEQQLRQSQKMEAIGQLTGGVAHDFNNLIGVILGNLDLLERMVANNETATKRVRTAQKAAIRGAELTKRLLAFSRRQPLHPLPTSLDETIQNLLDMAARALGPEIDIVTDLDHSIPAVFVDAVGLENSLLNLAVNGRDAMPQGGSLTISTQLIEVDQNPLPVHSGELNPGRYACIRVADTGKGMSRETLERAFEPFFTTKPRGKGTGLGLATVYGFVKQSGGNVRIYSEPGIGTTVSLYLPLAGGSPVPVPSAKSLRGAPAKASGTVLVVDDEVDLLEIAVVFLEEMGFKVFHATDGPRALQIAARQPDITLLITDIFMPGGMSGVEVADKVGQLIPDIKILYSSGFASDALAERSGTRLDGPLIYKPYQRDEFTDLVLRTMESDNADHTAHPEVAT